MIYQNEYSNIGPKTGNAIGSTAGSAEIAIASAINPIAGLALQGGKMLSGMIKTDANGTYSSGLAAYGSSFLDPTKTWDSAFSEMKGGNFTKGLGMMLPGIGGILENNEKKKDIADLSKKNYMENQVGEFNPFAGRFTGEATGVNKIYHNYKPQML